MDGKGNSCGSCILMKFDQVGVLIFLLYCCLTVNLVSLLDNKIAFNYLVTVFLRGTQYQRWREHSNLRCVSVCLGRLISADGT